MKLSDFQQQGSKHDKIKFLLHLATRAPSTHNSQPWKFKLTDSGCQVFIDPDKKIPVGDRLGRDQHISLGCLLANLEVAGRYFGVWENIRLWPADDADLIAEVSFKNLDQPKPDQSFGKLAQAILDRVNVRGTFEPQPLAPDLVKAISTLRADELRLDLVTDKPTITRLAELTAEGLLQAYRDPAFRREMSGWINSNRSPKKEGLHGYSLRMSRAQSHVIPRLVKYVNLGKKLAKSNYDSLVSAPAVCVISAPENSKLTWLETGRLAQRIMLEATSRGYQSSIFVAAVEMGELYQEVQKVLDHQLIPQFLFCIGRVPDADWVTPRHHIDRKLT